MMQETKDFAICLLVMVAVLWLAIGCSAVPQKLDPTLFYKKDLPLCIQNGPGCFEGVAVLPRQASYDIEAAPKGDANIDLMVVTSCHREDTYEKTSSGWFIFQSKSKFKYTYQPIRGIEDDGDCPLMLNTFEKDKGRHAWSLLVFEHPKYQLPAHLSCNGSVKQYKGVSICQSKTGLSQRIGFPEKVMIEADKGCPVPRKVDGEYEWPIGDKECGYTFRSESGLLHNLTTIGYSQVLVRGEK